MNELCLTAKFQVWKGSLGACQGRWRALESPAGRADHWGGRGRDRSQKRLTSSRPARASRPGVFPARLGAGPGPAGLEAGTEPRRVCTPVNRKRKREAWRDWPAGWWGVPGVGAGIWGTPAGASRLACFGVGAEVPPPPSGLRVLCKMRPPLRAVRELMGDGGRGARGGQRGPDTE